MNNLQQPTQQQLSFIAELVKRFKSKSPAFFVRIQNWCVVFGSICGTIISANNYGLLVFIPPNIDTHLMNVLSVILAVLVGGGLLAKLPTTDPSLIPNEVKDAVLNNTTPPAAQIQTTDTPAQTINIHVHNVPANIANPLPSDATPLPQTITLSTAIPLK